MTVLVALALALGVLLVFDGLTRATPRRRPGIGSRFGAWLAAAGLAQVRPAQFLGVSAALGLAFGVAVLVAVGSTGVALLAVAAGALGTDRLAPSAPTIGADATAARLGPTRSSCWRASVRAGDTLTAAVAVVAERGPEPLRPVFAAIVRDHRITGDLVGALERVATSMADPVCDRVVATFGDRGPCRGTRPRPGAAHPRGLPA